MSASFLLFVIVKGQCVQLILGIYWFSVTDAPSAAWRSCKYGRVAVWGSCGVGEFRCVVVDMWGVVV